MTTRPIDLRSDTVTKPSPEMRRAMAEAEVGDDVIDVDPGEGIKLRYERLQCGQVAAELSEFGLDLVRFAPPSATCSPYHIVDNPFQSRQVRLVLLHYEGVIHRHQTSRGPQDLLCH